MASNPSTSNQGGAASYPRQYVSGQRRYDNMRVRETDMQHRLCRECGRIVHGDDLNFQHHVISHEAAFICYQIYHFEKGNTLPKNYHGESRAKFTKDRVSAGPRKYGTRKVSKPSESRKRKIDLPPIQTKPRKQPMPKAPLFINDRPLNNELNLSEDESAVSHITSESDSVEEVLLPIDDNDEKTNEEQDPSQLDCRELETIRLIKSA